MSHDVQLREALRVAQTIGHGVQSEPGDYAELANEDEPDGVVVIRRADGTEKMFMSRATFESLRAKLGGD